ncbi:DNA helicase MCM9-like [Entelurus aequoreus]|uniref:DNA helicase MCM9-like n=1 Tax=Entelurus aequoreus TaxID=161455 RepID=UPI002B1E0355|nr:DNA helicase MCM9-like [Entelurus aequoreus]
MAISAEQEALISQMFEAYVAEYHHDVIVQLFSDSSEDIHQPLVINAMTLFEANMEIGDYFNAYPNDVLAIFDKVLHKSALELSKKASTKQSGRRAAEETRKKHTLHARITGLPVCPELTRDTIPRSRDVGHFLSVIGTVIRSSVAKVLEYERDYMCTKCRHVFALQADFNQFYTFSPPLACPNPDGCNSFKFTCLSGGSEPAACRDYQEIKIQEQVQRLSVGSIPRSLVVVLEDDLVDMCKSGDDVTVYGVVCQRWKPFFDGTRCDVELVLKANNIEVNNQQGAAALLIEDAQREFEEFWEFYKCDPIAGRNQILLSLCPQVFGMYVIKLAVAMVLAGGVQRIDSSGTKVRGECHMLLVGDPGTGKSQFLKYAAKIMPRSVLTAGIGSTSAGLTVAAVKDGGEWHLEAGALVLSDGGLCCIDEFNSIKEHDRISIHEAMEQQSISVAKAGMVCKLNTRTTILAATNPKGQYDPNQPLSVNVALASPLLSRFDLVLVLLDTRNAEWDRIISSFVLENRGLPSESSVLWPIEKMRAYFCVIRRLQPQVSTEANCILSRYYQLQRQSEGRNAARTTIRMLESLSRLAEAHARLMFRETVTIEDAVMAVSVMESSMQGGGLLGSVNAILTSFPDDPGKQYQTQCQVLLEAMNLTHLLHKEMDRVTRLRSNITGASSSEQPADQQQLGQTSSICKTQADIPKDRKAATELETSLDWFHSITPSLSEHPTSTPMSSATPVDVSPKPISSLSSHVSSSVKAILNSAETATFEDRGSVKDDNHKAQESLKELDRKCTKPSGSVTQKVRKNLRDRRVKELQRQQQPFEQGQSVVSVNSASLDGTDNTCLNQSKQDYGGRSLLEVGVGGCHRATKKLSNVSQEKMTATVETNQNIHAKFSGFTFKPRKMRPLVHNAGLNVHAEMQQEFNQEAGKAGRNMASGKRIDGRADGENNDNEKINQMQQMHLRSLEDGSQVSCVISEAAFCLPSQKVDQEKQDQVHGKTKQGEDTRTVCLNGDGTKDCLTPLKPPTCKPRVNPSTLARLSRFSFTVETKTDTNRNHQTELETSPFKRDGVDVSRTTTQGQLSPMRKRKRDVVSSEITATSSSLVSHDLDHGPGTSDGPILNCSPVLTEPAQAAVSLIEIAKDLETKKKRKCFELGCPTKDVSLFGSGEFSDDVLDTDWDKEITK